MATFMGAAGAYSCNERACILLRCKIIAWSQLLSCFLSFPRSWNYPDIEGKWEDYRKKVASSLDESDADIGIHLSRYIISGYRSVR